MCFALAAVARGQRVMFFTFDETLATLVARSEQLGMKANPAITDGRLVIQQIDPAEISPGEMAHRIKQGVMRDNVRMVVIDSLNGYLQAMPDQRHLTLHLHELLAYLAQQGVVSLMVLTQQGLVGMMQTPVDLTYLADTVVLLRYFETSGHVRQAISVIKKRSGDHERTIREFSLGPGGAKVGEPLEGFTGVLTGVPMMTSQPRRET
jgi:circadian clock protein KaiC